MGLSARPSCRRIEVSAGQEATRTAPSCERNVPVKASGFSRGVDAVGEPVFSGEAVPRRLSPARSNCERLWIAGADHARTFKSDRSAHGVNLCKSRRGAYLPRRRSPGDERTNQDQKLQLGISHECPAQTKQAPARCRVSAWFHWYIWNF